MNEIKKSARLTVAITLALLPGLAAADDGIKVYRVPKERPVEMAQNNLPAGHPATGGETAPARPKLTYTKPDGWTEVKAGELRAASFNIKGDGGQADVSVIPLGGAAGGDLNNVNRWRSQVGLGAVEADALKKLAEAVEISGQPADLFDFAGTNPSSGDKTRIIAAVLHREGTAWFFKMTGDESVVTKQKPAFVAFLKSVKFTAATDSAPDSAMDASTLPAGHPDISALQNASQQSAPAAAVSKEGQPKWTVPAGWKEIPGGQFLVAKFMITGEAGAQAAVNVSNSGGDGGGLAANVNRWRSQLGLQPATEADLQKQTKPFDTSGGKATWVELTGKDARTGQPTKLVGAVLVRGKESWFYKLMGDAKIVDAQTEAFSKFVKDATY